MFLLYGNEKQICLLFVPRLNTLRQQGGVAQLGERRLCKPEVGGSSPLTSTNNAGYVCFSFHALIH